MIQIDEAFVDTAAPNVNAIKNGRGLVLKGKFLSFHRDSDDSLVFGECGGSGRSNYHCSADFIVPDKPVYRCSCPSRQFPCKHTLGLLYAFVDGKKFSVAEVPEDIAEKRTKSEQRAAKKKATASDPKKPRKVNKSALKKKITAQLEGLDLLETLVTDLIRGGMGSLTPKAASQIEQQAKQLGNTFLPGAQGALNEFTELFSRTRQWWEAEEKPSDRDAIYSEAFDRLTRVHALVKQGRKYLQQRLDDPELKPETETAIAAWLGHAWQLTELREAGLMQTDVELIQLAFHCINHTARREWIDTGIWLNLNTGAIQLTQNFRPYRAAKYINEDDSFFQVVQTKELFVYPGNLNPRVRWDEMASRPSEAADITKVREHAAADLAEVIKTVKNQLKSPLADKQPLALVSFSRIARTETGDCVLEDESGNRLILSDAGHTDLPGLMHLIPMLPDEALKNQAILLRFHHDLDARTLTAKPLSIVTESEVVRLTY